MLNIYYTRHCNTIENLIENLYLQTQSLTNEKIKDYNHLFIQNPSLSNFGIIHGLETISKYNFDKNIHPNVVCASYYVRTWQTAFILYNNYFKNNGTLYILPYIHECHSEKVDIKKEHLLYNIKESMKRFILFIKYLKKFMKNNYINLYNDFTFEIPKIVFLNKYGKEVSLEKAYNINYYKKYIYLYEPNIKKFENKILPKFLNNLSIKIDNIGIIVHGLLIQRYILKKKDILVNNCNTYLIKYKINNNSFLRKNIYTKYKSLTFYLPHFHMKISHYNNPIYKIFVKKNMKLNKKYILGLYYNKKVIKYFDYLLSYYKK